MARKAPNPTGKGGFKKGRSGNPAGPRKETDDTRAAKALIRSVCVEAVELKLRFMRDAEVPEQLRDRIAAELLDRAIGKPTQPIAGDDEHAAIQVNSDEIHARLVKMLTNATDS